MVRRSAGRTKCRNAAIRIRRAAFSRHETGRARWSRRGRRDARAAGARRFPGRARGGVKTRRGAGGGGGRERADGEGRGGRGRATRGAAPKRRGAAMPPGRDDERHSRRAQPPVRATRFGNAPRARELDVLREARVRCDGRECRRSRPPRPRRRDRALREPPPGPYFFPPWKATKIFFFFPDRSRGSLKPQTENLPRLAILIDQKISRERRFGSAVSSISVRRETIG